MVGNDIVDLRDPDSDSTSYRSRFDERVFTAAERRLIGAAASPERQRWRLWAAKEASYKLARKRDRSVVFSPRAFAVATHEGTRFDSVRVVHDTLSCFVQFDESPERIHAIAVPAIKDFALVFSGIEMIDATAKPGGESKAVRELACAAISRRCDYSRDQLEIRRAADRIPKLYQLDNQLDHSVSLSHHGGWLAFALRTTGSPTCCTGEDRGA